MCVCPTNSQCDTSLPTRQKCNPHINNSSFLPRGAKGAALIWRVYFSNKFSLWKFCKTRARLRRENPAKYVYRNRVCVFVRVHVAVRIQIPLCGSPDWNRLPTFRTYVERNRMKGERDSSLICDGHGFYWNRKEPIRQEKKMFFQHRDSTWEYCVCLVTDNAIMLFGFMRVNCLTKFNWKIG